MMRVLGAILAGGRSSRFGSDKAMALLEGRPLIAHVIAGLKPQVETVVVCGRAYGGLTGLVDRPAPDLGPLGGLNAALHHASDKGYEAVLTIGCDMPRVPHNLIEIMAGHAPAVLLGQRLVGLWPARLAPVLDAYLGQSEDRSIRGWMRHVGAREVPCAAYIANVNSAADLAALATAE